MTVQEQQAETKSTPSKKNLNRFDFPGGYRNPLEFDPLADSVAKHNAALDKIANWERCISGSLRYMEETLAGFSQQQQQIQTAFAKAALYQVPQVYAFDNQLAQFNDAIMKSAERYQNPFAAFEKNQLQIEKASAQILNLHASSTLAARSHFEDPIAKNWKIAQAAAKLQQPTGVFAEIEKQRLMYGIGIDPAFTPYNDTVMKSAKLAEQTFAGFRAKDFAATLDIFQRPAFNAIDAALSKYDKTVMQSAKLMDQALGHHHQHLQDLHRATNAALSKYDNTVMQSAKLMDQALGGLAHQHQHLQDLHRATNSLNALIEQARTQNMLPIQRSPEFAPIIIAPELRRFLSLHEFLSLGVANLENDISSFEDLARIGALGVPALIALRLNRLKAKVSYCLERLEAAEETPVFILRETSPRAAEIFQLLFQIREHLSSGAIELEQLFLCF